MNDVPNKTRRENRPRFATRTIHAGQEPDPSTGAIMQPIYATSTYVQESPGVHKGYEYSRTQNPTRMAYERCVADLESGCAGFAFASGMAATATALELLDAGSHVIAVGFAVPDYSELRSYQDVPDEGPLPESLQRHVLHGYYAATTYMDANVGKVLTELDRQGLRDNTIIVLWGDHGWHLGEQGHWGKITNFEVCVRSPLIVSVPGQPNQGAHTSALTEFVDIYPGLAGLCGLPIRAELEGYSFAPLLDDPTRQWSPRTGRIALCSRS